MNPTDELPMPHFEDRLWAEIRAQHDKGAWTPTRAGHASPPLVLARPATAVHRRTARRSLAAAAVLAVIAATAALASLGTTDSRSPSPSTQPPSGTLPDQEVATLTIAAIDEALDDSIVHSVTDNTDTGDGEVWHDETTGAERHTLSSGDNTPLFDVGFAVIPGPDDEPSTSALIREVDYCFSDYSDTEQPWLPVGTEAQQIRDQLADGTLVASGTEVVDGRELIRLLQPVPEGMPEDTDAAVYVDPDTYRPLLQRIYPGTEYETIVTIEYLPRTPENLSLLVPTVPAGFTQVAAPHEKDELDSAGCLD